MATSYSEVLGGAWQDLPPAVRRSLTSPLLAKGSLDVCPPSGRLARVVARLIKVPPAGRGVVSSLELNQTGPTTRWIRSFGEMRAVSDQRLVGGSIVESAGPYQFELVPRVEGNALIVSSGRLRLLGIPAPRWCGPSIVAKLSEGPDELSWRLGVRIGHPWFGVISQYAGVMRAE